MATIRNNISIFSSIGNTKSGSQIPLDIFLENIRSGYWQDLVLPIRAIVDKKERDTAKKRVPYATISGTFTERTDAALEHHSGFVGIDIDDLDDPEATKEQIISDQYVAAAFRSISGRGLCLLFKIVPDKHREAFQGISEYLFKNYQLICDPTSINVSRARFVSYDPHLYINEAALKFTMYPKDKPPKKVEKVIFSKDDFGEILKQIQERKINITQDRYQVWLAIAFAISHKFGEAGRQDFHLVSSYSAKYDPRVTDRQYDACLRHKSNGREAHIETFYHYCKEAGVNLYTERTKLIAYTTINNKKAGLDIAGVKKTLADFEGITDADDIIEQVFNSNIELNEDTLLDQLELWIRQNYSLRRNEITRYIEHNGTPLQQKDFNSIYVKAKKVFEKLNFELLDRLINSDFVPTYNPLREFFLNNEEPEFTGYTPLIDKVLGAIETTDREYLLHFGRKWFVGAVSAAFGEHSSLMLVLSGERQNTGKTEWFRRLLPPELKQYYAESKLDAGKDDEILMTQKWIIVDDEMGGKSKKETKRLKELTSKQTFSLREPYGRNNVDLCRLAVLGGTTNDNELLSDPTGNRRIIPILVTAIQHQQYNDVDKAAMWLEAYSMWRNGWQWRMTKEDIEYLAKDTHYFEVSNSEAELIQKHFKKGEEAFTATDIKIVLENASNQKLSLDRIGKELKRMGFEQKIVKLDGATKRVYLVTPLGQNRVTGYEPALDGTPF